MKICFLGWYGKNNAGDEAFKLAHETMFPGIEKVYTCDKIDDTADVLILGGGDVIKPFYLDRIGDRPFYALGVGLGYESEINLLKKKNVKEVVFRNKVDCKIGNDAGIKALYAPDLMFVKRIKKIEKTSGRKRATVILSDAINPSVNKINNSSLYYSEYFKWELAKALDELNKWYALTFVPFSDERFDRDYKIILEVTDRMKEIQKDTIIHKPFQTDMAKSCMAVVASSDLVVSMKFHGLVFATMGQIPFVNIGFTRKSEVFCNETNVPFMSVPPFGFTLDRFIGCVTRAEHFAKNPAISDGHGHFDPWPDTTIDDNADKLKKIADHVKTNWLKI